VRGGLGGAAADAGLSASMAWGRNCQSFCCLGLCPWKEQQRTPTAWGAADCCRTCWLPVQASDIQRASQTCKSYTDQMTTRQEKRHMTESQCSYKLQHTGARNTGIHSWIWVESLEACGRLLKSSGKAKLLLVFCPDQDTAAFLLSSLKLAA
jgi:hypothetical protein